MALVRPLARVRQVLVLLVLVRLLVPAVPRPLREPVAPLLAQRLALVVHPVRVPVVPVQRLPWRRSLSAATASSTT
jgi:hypothetical protein